MPDNVRYEVRLKAVNDAPPAFSGQLSGVRFDPATTSVRFVRASLEDVDFSNLHIESFHAQASVFERCDFSGATLRDGTFSIPPASTYRDCRFDRAKLRFQNPGLARFERCSFDHTVIDHWICSANDFIDCTFVGRFRDIEFSGGMNPTEYLLPGIARKANEFHGNDFSRARLVATDFTGGIDLNAQTLPSGPGYRRFNIEPEVVERVEALIPSLSSDEQEQARRLVGWFRARYAGQREVFTEWPPLWGFDLYEKLLAMADAG